MNAVKHLTLAELETGLELIRQSPADNGRLELIVRRPQGEARESLEVGQLDTEDGLVGDNWKMRPSSRTADNSPHPEMQLTLMNARAIALLAVEKERWPLAGDQLYVDLDLSTENLPAGTRLALGEAVIEVTSQPHTGCAKFVARYGLEAQKFVNSPVGKQLHLRGINTRVVKSGMIRVGDRLRKIQ